MTVNGLDEHGNPVQFEATGWFARCMQHETDHLDGKLYVNRLNKKWTSKMKKVVKKEGWTSTETRGRPAWTRIRSATNHELF